LKPFHNFAQCHLLDSGILVAMRRTILTLIVVLAGTAPTSAAILGGNSPLDESFLKTSIEQVAGELSRELLPGWSGTWLRRAAEFFVAPGGLLRGRWVPESTAGWSQRAIAYQEQITGRAAGMA
jgi:hypothetical protein